MRKVAGVVGAVALTAAAAAWVGLPIRAGAQGGGTIEVEVHYNGAPVIEDIKVNKDVEVCGKEKRIDKIGVGPNKGLADTLAWVTDAKGPVTSKPVTLDQKGCEFHPRVLPMLPGEIDILNSDGVLHNIHTFSSLNPTINKAQPKFKKVMKEKLEKPEIVRVQCDVHSWMQGWVVVVPNPFFGVTDGRGVTKIENVPPGKHQVEVWHPLLAKQTKEVEVKAGQAVKVAVELKK
jgi:plastocyanin